MAATKSIVLVTGGNNGIGFETCRLLSKQPQFHVIMGSRTLSKGEIALADIKKLHSDASISLVQLDIDSDASIQAAAKEVASRWDKLDVLINNAGVCPLTFDRNVLRDTIETNAISPAVVTLAFAPLLRKSPAGRVIYVSSSLGSITQRSDPKGWVRHEDYKAYRISKAALNMLVACDSWEFEKDGIKVFAYCPGYVVSDLANMRQKKIDQGVQTPEISARGMLNIADGKRDAEAGMYLHNKDGVEGTYPW